jgi:hypothetical protein
MSISTERPTNVASQPSANASGETGLSTEPSGVLYVFLPIGLVGEYCP